MTWWALRWGRFKLNPKEIRQALPPKSQGLALGGETRIDFHFRILTHWIIYVDENLIEDLRELTHSHEA
jgi:hypothetical protein